ncbi:leucyl aminopeptidase [Thalassotalea agarivorans]|uniref:Leucyl aminopeptidase n=2 Tax=Thalassotalea agarivorans TaxID=349064 RepID=A0A1I0GSZ4_THASX|nr:leucyl aminopeptidase family protein [Thalassotalea agarivorans]SET74271.1 leucyl aminopeptidase [Thalassotalea agarivorans]
MTILLTNSGDIPLHVIEQKAFATWLSEQEEHVQNWLLHTNFSSGVTTIPGESGRIALALCVANNIDQFFATGDLVNKLPPNSYQLMTHEGAELATAFSWLAGSYRFSRYLEQSNTFPTLALENQAVIDTATQLFDATAMVRDLVNTPAGDMMPEHLSETMQALAAKFSGDFSEIVGDELLTENYPTIHAVGRASVHAPRLLDLTWGDENAPKVTLVGKGVCFDSGGLDLKPAAGMRQMKKDMGGSAHVIGLAQLIMSANLPVRLRVLVPAVENAVAGNAFRPGDVIKTRQGLTVEIDNTDAEGRLVMCDALTEAETQSPDLLIDFATLTGAMRVALGTELPGFFSTSKNIANELIEAGDAVDDPVWQMPLFQSYNDLLKSDIADLSNCAVGPFGGAITAALYLQHFVGASTNWLHFDIMAFNNRALPGKPKGGEAFGIRAVFEYLQRRYSA